MKQLADKVGYKVNHIDPVPQKNVQSTINANNIVHINGSQHKKPEKKILKPCTPFFLFMRDKRKDIVKAYPYLPITQITKLFGNVWKEFSDLEKKPYMDSYYAAQIRYKQFMEKRQQMLMI